MTAFDLAQRFVGEIREIPGAPSHPFIQFGHMLCGLDPETPDEVPWCSSFVNSIAWLLRLPRSKSASARSWLTIGRVIDNLTDGVIGFDVVILQRGTGLQPGPEVIFAPGHVGFFAGLTGTTVHVLGGNQSNQVTIAPFSVDKVLGLRRIEVT